MQTMSRKKEAASLSPTHLPALAYGLPWAGTGVTALFGGSSCLTLATVQDSASLMGVLLFPRREYEALGFSSQATDGQLVREDLGQCGSRAGNSPLAQVMALTWLY